MAEGLKIEGMDELLRKLSTLDKKSGKRVLRKSTRAASAIFLKAVRKAAPVGPTGNLKKSVGRQYKWNGRASTDVAKTGPQFAKEGEEPHGHLVELGTKERTVKNLYGRPGVSASTGKVAGKPWAEPAIEAVRSTAEEASVAALKKALDTEIKAVSSGG